MANDKLKRFLDSVVSKTVLALLAILGTGITIYAFLQEKKVNLRYEVIANTNVLDFNADINKLEVYYDSTNLKQTKENLRIYTVKIINNGDKDILNNLYDPNEPLGIKISSGRIIEPPEIIESSSDYIKRNLKVIDYQRDKISFSQIIIESGEYFIVKLLVLHSKDDTPNILSTGKIAGQSSVSVVNAIDVKNKTSFWSLVFYGNVWVQLLRLLSYFIAGIVISVFIFLMSESIDSYRTKKKRLKRISEFKGLNTYQYSKMDDAIFDRYKLHGDSQFYRMQTLIENEKNLNEIYVKITEQLSSKEYRLFRNSENSTIAGQNNVSNDFTIINKMISDGIIIKEHDVLVVNKAMRNTLNKFNHFLKEKK